MGKLDGKVIIITGASRGLGKQMAIRAAEEGANVTICARTVSKLNITEQLCREAGAKVLNLPTDVCDYNQLKRLVDRTVETFGKLDGLVNDAVSSTPFVPFIQQTHKDIDKVMISGFYATWDLMQLCYPALKANGGGSIVNLGSGAAENGIAGLASYAAAKAAIIALTKVAANEWGRDGIRVNNLDPAAITDSYSDTLSKENLEKARSQVSHNALGRPGDPYKDIAPVVAFLLSDDSRFITGQTIRVEGGICMV